MIFKDPIIPKEKRKSKDNSGRSLKIILYSIQ